MIAEGSGNNSNSMAATLPQPGIGGPITETPFTPALYLGCMRRGRDLSNWSIRLDQAKTASRDVETWLQRFRQASTDEERLFYLSRIQALDPQNERAMQLMAQMMRSYLRHDPFLAYLEEDPDLYRVRTARDLILVLAKNRAVPESYSPQRFGPFGRAYRDLMLSVLGLVLSGPLAIVFGLLSVVSAARAASQTQGRARLRAVAIIIIALLVLLPAVVLSYLLWLHVIG